MKVAKGKAVNPLAASYYVPGGFGRGSFAKSFLGDVSSFLRWNPGGPGRPGLGDYDMFTPVNDPWKTWPSNSWDEWDDYVVRGGLSGLGQIPAAATTYSGSPDPDNAAWLQAMGPRNPLSYTDRQLRVSKGISQLKEWMARTMPAAYRAVMARAPYLLDPENVGVASGAGNFGLGQDDLWDVAPGADAAASSTGAIIGSAATSGGPGSGSSWLNDIMSIAKQALPIAGQAQLLQTNLARAKQGLPPIDPSTIAPTVNVGVSRPTLLAGGGGLLAIGAIVLGAVLLSKRR